MGQRFALCRPNSPRMARIRAFRGITSGEQVSPMWDGSMGEKSAEANGKPTTPPSVEELVVQFADRLYRIAYRLTNRADVAEDLVQEAFLDAHRNLGQLRSSDSAFAWLVSILRRRRVKWLKGNARLAT